ncbi:MAG: ABC transporter permease [Vallitaleaceae bacterium]|nr:ABC transporter permease [Vallitaleaceae bacterium]
MPVFKICMKVFKKNLPAMIIYVVIFLAVSLLIANATRNENQKGFSQTRRPIAIFSNEDSPIIDALKEELSKVAQIIEIENDQESIQDALYFREVYYILRIPDGFSENFMKGEVMQLEKTVIPNSVDNVYLDMQVEQFFKVAKLYAKSMKAITMEELASYVKRDMANSANLAMQSLEGEKTDQSYANYYFNYLAYSLFSVLVLGISTIILVFNNVHIKRRNACSPISSSSRNFQFLMANAVFSTIVWMIMVAFCILFDLENSKSMNTVLFLANSLVFTVCAASISFLIGHFAKNQEAVSAITNVVALGPSFISGVFVPQAFLGPQVLKIASFTPTYWYVKANNVIAGLNQFDQDSLKELFQIMGVEIGFAVAFVALTLAVGKRKQYAEA